jgi:hypothetical protein
VSRQTGTVVVDRLGLGEQELTDGKQGLSQGEQKDWSTIRETGPKAGGLTMSRTTGHHQELDDQVCGLGQSTL